MTKKGCSCRILCSSRTGFWVFRVRFHKCNIKLSLFVSKRFNVLMHSCIRAKQLPREVKILSILCLYLVTKLKQPESSVYFLSCSKTHYLHTIICQNECKYELISYVFLTYEIRIMVYYPGLILTKLNSKCFSLHIRSCISIG